MSLKRQALSGTLWTTVSAAVRALIQILRLSILTRYLEKSDFGLVAIVVLVLGFTHIFTDLGVSASLFSTKKIKKTTYSSLYWVGLLLALLLYVLLYLFTPWVAAFYHLPELNKLIPLMGLDLIFVTAGRQFRVFREKALRFKSLAIIDISCLLLSLLVAVWLAMEGAGVYSLILSALFASFSSSLLLIITGYRHHPLVWHINLKEGHSFYRIGFFQTGTQVLDYFASQLDILLIGKLMPVSDLGVYNLVKQLVSRIYGMVNPIITQVAVPVLATIRDRLDRLKDKYLQMIEVIAFANFGLYGVLALLAQEVLLTLYGPAYQEAHGILAILCIWGSLSAIGSGVSTIVIFMGKTDLGFYRTILRVLVNPAFVIVGAFYGLIGIVIGQACYSILFFAVNWRLLIYRIIRNITFGEYAKRALPFLAYATVIFIVLKWLEMNIPLMNHWTRMILWGTAYGLLYLACTRKFLREFLKFIRKDETAVG